MATELVRNPGQGELEGTRKAREIAPPVDVYENDQELLIVADMPGVEKEGLTVELDPPELRFVGQHGHNGTTESYVRAFRITEAIDPEGISAELKDGVLTIHLKKSEALRPRRIEVRAS